MKFEVRQTLNDKDEPILRGLLFISENEVESKVIDVVFGDQPNDDGLIGVRRAEARVSDGYGEHYIYISTENGATSDLIAAGKKVVERWETGDLAAAVRELDQAIKKAKGRG